MPKSATSRILLNDGTALENSYCGYYGKSLWCYLKGLTFTEAFELFSNHERFKKIIYEYSINNVLKRTTYDGLTDLSAIEKKEFSVDVRLEGEHAVVTEEQEIIEEEEEDSNEDQLESSV